jgi:hypothetical protein
MLTPLLLLLLAAPLSGEEISATARRERSTLVNLHRGAWEFAPPNTLAAFRAALYYGADVLEVDIRRSADGQLVCFHDDAVDGDLDGIGLVAELRYDELRAMPFAPRYPVHWRREPVPLFADVLAFAQEHGLLFHLDIKVAGIDAEIAELFSSADYWHGIATTNDYNSEAIRTDPRYHPLPVKGGLLENFLDGEFDRIGALNERPGQWLIVDDPRLPAAWLGRLLPAQTPAIWTSSERATRTTDPQRRAHWLRELNANAAANTDEAARIEQTLRRARAALGLGYMPYEEETIEALRRCLRQPSTHADYLYHALDAAMAARALGRLGASESQPDLERALESTYTQKVAVQLADKGWSEAHFWWLDYRLYREAIFALATLNNPGAQTPLRALIAGKFPLAAHAAQPQLQALAADAIALNAPVNEETIAWLTHANARVRRRAFFALLAHPTPQTAELLCRQIIRWRDAELHSDAIALAISAFRFLPERERALSLLENAHDQRVRAAAQFARGDAVNLDYLSERDGQ